MMETYRKKIDIDPQNSERLLSVDNPTRLVNSLIEKHFSGTLITLTEENKTAISIVCSKTGESINEIINKVIASLEIEVKIPKPKPKTKVTLGKKISHQKSNYVVDI